MSKGPASWPLRYKSPADYPHIAKFADAVPWAEANPPMMMYFEEEELKREDDDPLEPVVKDAEYWKKKDKQRNSYRKKKKLVLEDSSHQPGMRSENSTGGIRFEGKKVNLGLADNEDAKQKLQNVEEAPFRYVLLQFVKKASATAGGAPTSEINVIPVGDMYNFNKAPYVPDELLAEIDERFIQERQRSKDSIGKYKGINALPEERGRLGMGSGANGEGTTGIEYSGGFDSTSLFGANVNKSRNKKEREGPIAVTTFLNENGMDLDELNEENIRHGDYTTRFADDEEEFVTVEQKRQELQVELELSGADRNASGRGDDEDDDSDEDKEDDDDEDKFEEEEVGMVDDSMVTNAAEARKLFLSSNKNTSGSGAGSGAGGAAAAASSAPSNKAPTKSALKRPREEYSDAIGSGTGTGDAGQGGGRGKVSFNGATGGSSASASGSGSGSGSGGAAAPSAAASGSASGAGIEEYPLTEQGVRQFILNKGGSVTPKDLEVLL
jgi:hypothetical protein